MKLFWFLFLALFVSSVLSVNVNMMEDSDDEDDDYTRGMRVEAVDPPTAYDSEVSSPVNPYKKRFSVESGLVASRVESFSAREPAEAGKGRKSSPSRRTVKKRVEQFSGGLAKMRPDAAPEPNAAPEPAARFGGYGRSRLGYDHFEGLDLRGPEHQNLKPQSPELSIVA